MLYVFVVLCAIEFDPNLIFSIVFKLLEMASMKLRFLSFRFYFFFPFSSIILVALFFNLESLLRCTHTNVASRPSSSSSKSSTMTIGTNVLRCATIVNSNLAKSYQGISLIVQFLLECGIVSARILSPQLYSIRYLLGGEMASIVVAQILHTTSRNKRASHLPIIFLFIDH